MRVCELDFRKQQNFKHPIHVIQCKAQNACRVTAQQPNENYVNENQQQQQQQHPSPPTTAENVMMNKNICQRIVILNVNLQKKRRFRIYSMFEYNEGEEEKRVK